MGNAGGFTLIEVLLALTVLAVGVLGLAAESAALTRHLARAERTALVVASAAGRLERLRDAACTTQNDGAESVVRGRMTLAILQWSWSAIGDSTYRVRLVATPRGLAGRHQERPDTLTITVLCRH